MNEQLLKTSRTDALSSGKKLRKTVLAGAGTLYAIIRLHLMMLYYFRARKTRKSLFMITFFGTFRALKFRNSKKL